MGIELAALLPELAERIRRKAVPDRYDIAVAEAVMDLNPEQLREQLLVFATLLRLYREEFGWDQREAAASVLRLLSR